MKDLAESIQTSRQAVELTPIATDHSDRAGGLKRDEGPRRGNPDLWQAVELTLADHPDRAAWLNNLGNKLGLRFERTEEMKDLQEALRCLYDAWDCTNAMLSVPLPAV
jgi:hypothetical protein